MKMWRISGNGWSYSCIAGDPVLGKEAYHYATMHWKASTSLELVHAQMRALAAALEAAGITVVRQKIEQIIYDTKIPHLSGSSNGRKSCFEQDNAGSIPAPESTTGEGENG